MATKIRTMYKDREMVGEDLEAYNKGDAEFSEKEPDYFNQIYGNYGDVDKAYKVREQYIDRALANTPTRTAMKQQQAMANEQLLLARAAFAEQKRYNDEQIKYLNEQRAYIKSEQEAATLAEQEAQKKLEGRNRRRLSLIETSNQGVLENAPTARGKVLGN